MLYMISTNHVSKSILKGSVEDSMNHDTRTHTPPPQLHKIRMETGDVLLFESRYKGAFGWWAWIVSLVTRSKYTHVALVLKDPTYICKEYKGLYVIECGSEEWESRWGVLVSPLQKILDDDSHSHVYHRALHTSIDVDLLMPSIYTTVMNKTYDTNLLELLGNELKSKLLANPRELDRFVCSSLVGYIFTALGALPKETKWFFMQPKHFSQSNTTLPLVRSSLGPEIEIYT